MKARAAGKIPEPAPGAEVRLEAEDVGRVLDCIADPAMVVDLVSRAVLRANARFLERAGVPAGETATPDLTELHDLRDLEKILTAAARRPPAASRLPAIVCRGRDGRSFTADLGVAPLAGGGGTLALLIYRPSDGAGPAAEKRAAGDARDLATFTRWLAGARDREGIGQVVVAAVQQLFGCDRALLVGCAGAPAATEGLAAAGFPPGAQEAIHAWLGGLIEAHLLPGDRVQIVPDIGREEALRAGGAELEEAGIRALVAVPLESDGRVIGALVLGFPDGRAARDCDLDRAQAFAAHLAGSLAGVFLLEQTRREKRHHEVLNRLISWLQGPFALDEILKSLTAELCRTLEADRAAVLLAAEANGEPGAVLRIGSEHSLPGQAALRALGPIRFAGTALGQAILYSKEPLAVEDLQVRPDLTEDHEDLVAAATLQGVLAAKILSRQEFVGLVLVATGGRSRAWSAPEIELVRAAADHVAVTLETGRLIEASRERAAQIERERREWERTFDAIPDMLSIHDGYGRLLRANLTMQVRLGGDPRAFAGRGCGEVLEMIMGRSSGCPHDEAVAARRALAREIQGERGAFALTAIPCFDAAGSCLYIIHVCKEITEEKQIREQLLQSEKMAAVGSLVSGVAHELNNPLAGVLGFTELLMEQQVDAKVRKAVERIRGEAERAARIVKNLLTFARKHKPEAVMTDLNAVLEKTLELRAYELRVNKIKVVTAFDPNLPRTLVDPNQLLQVFMNIITNAEQAVRDAAGKGTLTLRTRAAGAGIRVEIEDDGPGIKPENLKKIFDPFFTTKPVGKGTGLGLSICHGIVKEHGGTIAASSTVGRGTTFVIELPVVEGREAAPETGAATGRRTAAGRILVVDDELAIRELISDALTPRGHNVEVLDDGAAALEAIKRGTYDVVISDLKMPEMDGQELYARIEAECPAMRERIIFTSGDTVSAETRNFLERAGRPYLLKPFRVQELFEQVERLLPDAGRG